MSALVQLPPYGLRDDDLLLREMNDLTRLHMSGCREYRSIWPEWSSASCIEALPWLHVGVFKHIDFRTQGEDVVHERTLKSSATSSGVSSRIVLDRSSSELQSRSALAILQDYVGSNLRPLLILDSPKSLRLRNEISARVAAAMSLKPLAQELHFLLDDPADVNSMRWQMLVNLLDRFDDILVYGFTWILWQAFGSAVLPENVRLKLNGKRIHFVHSGGWKKLESLKVDRECFEQRLLHGLHPESRVVDYYGLVEQAGVIYPLCEYGYRHVPVWAQVIVRDPFTLASLDSSEGLLQLMNTLARGAPYHNVLTEDLGRLEPGLCPCGRSGARFQLLGRVANAELRGCSNA